MSERGLVVRQQSLADIEAALTRATETIATHLTGVLDTADTQMRGWTEETPSRRAQRDYERRLRAGIEQLTAALDEVRAEVAHHREDARSTEVENVAIVG
jgi:50S ribosomal subunit-associated GTPase HflX